ncbi:hypothetical protein F5141DRAFT_1064416 [Pisolithus sp. B1]|nr:hypothetical protein F5141DRAFT_1064416 [Pisolithus sp. B1]
MFVDLSVHYGLSRNVAEKYYLELAVKVTLQAAVPEAEAWIIEPPQVRTFVAHPGPEDGKRDPFVAITVVLLMRVASKPFFSALGKPASVFERYYKPEHGRASPIPKTEETYSGRAFIHIEVAVIHVYDSELPTLKKRPKSVPVVAHVRFKRSDLEIWTPTITNRNPEIELQAGQWSTGKSVPLPPSPSLDGRYCHLMMRVVRDMWKRYICRDQKARALGEHTGTSNTKILVIVSREMAKKHVHRVGHAESSGIELAAQQWFKGHRAFESLPVRPAIFPPSAFLLRLAFAQNTTAATSKYHPSRPQLISGQLRLPTLGVCIAAFPVPTLTVPVVLYCSERQDLTPNHSLSSHHHNVTNSSQAKPVKLTLLPHTTASPSTDSYSIIAPPVGFTINLPPTDSARALRSLLR